MSRTPEPGAGAHEGPSPPSFGSLTLRQRALLLAGGLLATLLLLVIVEAGLRVAGYGSGYPLFVPFESAPDYLYPNPEVGRRYFADPHDAPTPHPDLFHREKRPGDLRIFVQGGSSAAGFPYYGGGAFSQMLEQRLQSTFPDRSVEVVNLALDATNSYTILDLADEIVTRRPDAVILYAGHNEYYGVFGVASSRSVGRSPPLVRAWLRAQRVRVVQLLRAAFLEARRAWVRWTADEDRPPRTLMQRLAEEQDVRYASDLYAAGLAQYRSNLHALLERYRGAGIPVFLGTLASNVRGQRPFLPAPAAASDSVRWASRMAEARRAAAAGDTAGATEATDAAIAVDSAAAGGYFLRGRLLDVPGTRDAAREAYVAAKDRDRLPFRAPEGINRVLREEAAEHGAAVVEVRERLQAASPDGIIGDELMLEHLHPTVDGQFLTADAFYDALRAAGLPSGWDAAAVVPEAEARARIPVTAVDSLYGAYGISRLTAGWPFREENLRIVPADTLTPRNRVEEIALARLRGKLSWVESTLLLRDHYAGSGAYAGAVHVDLILGAVAPFTAEYHLHAARMAMRMGDRTRALELFRTAFEREPSVDAARMIGGLTARTGDREAARAWFARAARLAPQDRQAAAALGAFEELPALEAAARRHPADPDTLTQLGAVYLLTGQYGAARRSVERALELAPSHPAARRLREQLSRLPLPETDTAGTGS